MRAFVFLSLFLVTLPALAEARWPQFRGPNGQGVAEDQKPPIAFSPTKHLLWKVAIPKGQSSPCVWGDSVFLTAVEGEKLVTLGLRRSDGKLLWKQAAPAEKLERINRQYNSPATPTAACDGERVYVYFGSYGLLAYDLEGREVWRKPMAVGYVRHGTATSPVLAAGKLLVNVDQEGMKSFLIAVDPATGKTAWQVPRPSCFSSHTTPIARTGAGGVEELIVAGSVRLVAYDLRDGSERWSCRGLEAISICPSPAMGDGKIFGMSLSMGEGRLPTFDELLKQCDKNGDGKVSWSEANQIARDVFDVLDTDHDRVLTREEWDKYYHVFDEADHGLFAVRAPTDPAERGDLTATHVAWAQKRGIPEISSPLFYRGRVFVIRNGGLASCFNAISGEPIYQAKRLGAAGQYFASPIAADGRIYVCSGGGTITVIDAADEPRVLASNELDEAIEATPAMADNKLYVRTAEHLWAFGVEGK